jgi:hypothetical protein
LARARAHGGGWSGGGWRDGGRGGDGGGATAVAAVRRRAAMAGGDGRGAATAAVRPNNHKCPADANVGAFCHYCAPFLAELHRTLPPTPRSCCAMEVHMRTQYRPGQSRRAKPALAALPLLALLLVAPAPAPAMTSLLACRNAAWAEYNTCLVESGSEWEKKECDYGFVAEYAGLYVRPSCRSGPLT